MGEGNNAPAFDPINASPEEEADMMAGYLAVIRGESPPRLPTTAYEHGWRMAKNDRAGVIDADQQANAKRFLAQQRPALSGRGCEEGDGGADG